MAEVKGQADYRDPDHVPEKQEYDPSNVEPVARDIARFLRTKMYGVDVRESLARWVEINLAVAKFLRDDQTAFKADLTAKQKAVTDRQTDVEKRQTDVEGQFKTVIANATKDSEVILARDSTAYGKFAVLDDRLENIEALMAQAVPSGFTVTIHHGIGRNPTIAVRYYEYGIGTEPAGLGTAPGNKLGEINSQTVTSATTYPDANTAVVQLPIWFKLAGNAVLKPDGNYYLIDGYRTLKFDVGGLGVGTNTP